MINKIKIKLSILFIAGLTIILILLAIAYSVESIETVKYLKNSVFAVNKRTTERTSIAFMEEIVSRSADEFSGYFTGVANLTSIIAGKIQFDHKSGNFSKNDADNEIRMKYYPENQLYVSEPYTGVAAYYWGNEDSVPQKLYRDASVINGLFPFIKEVIKANSNYFYGIWLIDTEKYAFTYPRDNFYSKISNRKEIDSYFALAGNDMYSTNNTSANVSGLKPVWMIPYIDLLGKFTLSVFTPIQNASGKFSEAVGIDINLQEISKIIFARKLLSGSDTGVIEYSDRYNKQLTGFFFIIDRKGNIILFPSDKVEHFSLTDEYAKYYSSGRKNQGNLCNSKNIDIQKLGEKIIKNPFGIGKVNINGKTHIVAYSKMVSPDWILGLVILEKTLMPSVGQVENNIRTIENKMNIYFILIAVIFLVISIPVIILFFKFYFLNPLRNIRMGIKNIRKGNFNFHLEERGAAELADLSSAFNYLGLKLNDYMDNLKKETKARQAIETEIEIAASMQEQILAKTKIKYNKKEFDLYAQLDAAKDVSGDFYDYFYLDDDRLAILVADVSGKGLKAAFFMAMSKVLLKSNSYKYPDNPALVLKETNRLLCLDNEAQMFVTVFLVFYNFKTGELIYANGGHHNSIIVSNTGECKQFGILQNMALGCISDVNYISARARLKKEDLLFLFTDGIIEAVSPEDEEYGVKRLEQVLVKNKNYPIQKICSTVVKNVKDFEAGTQFDDITLVALKKSK